MTPRIFSACRACSLASAKAVNETHNFSKAARQLNVNEAARLAVLLPSPRKRDPRQLTPYLHERVVWVERQMRQLGSDYLTPMLN